MKFLIVCAFIATAVGAPQGVAEDDGQYRPDVQGVYNPQVVKYRPFAQQYRPVVPEPKYRVYSNEGKYTPQDYDDGQYHPDNSGAYTGDNSGSYNGDGSGAYSGDGSGGYRGDGSGGYKGDGSIRYKGRSPSPYPSGVQPSILVQTKPSYVQGKYSEKSGQYITQPSDNVHYRIIRKSEEILEDGYHYSYETENGILVEEEGHLVEKGTENEHMSVKGYYSYTGPDNVKYLVEYTSDAPNGFVPVGAHLPVPPQSPEQLVK